MGTWDHGLLDNDTALDGLSELDDGVIEDIVALGTAKPSRAVASKLAGAVGVLLQLSAYEFSEGAPRREHSRRHRGASAGHREAAEACARGARGSRRGQGEKLAKRPAKLKASTIKLFHTAPRHRALVYASPLSSRARKRSRTSRASSDALSR